MTQVRRAGLPVAASLVAILLVAALSGCAGAPPPPSPDREFELSIAHVNDHHSNVAPLIGETYVLDGVPTQVELGGFARLARLFREAEATQPNLLKLHAGDAITGTPYFTYFRGAADAAAMNSICFDAAIPGNHEFDAGDAALATFWDFLAADPRCHTTLLAANIHPSPGTPLAPPGRPPYLTPYTIKEVGGVRIGLVGVTVKNKTERASNPLPTTVLEDEATAAQRAIDELAALGVRHVVLMTHIGYDRDQELARRLRGVDVIIGGDSHSLLGDFRGIGLAKGESPYPTVVTGADGARVCIGQAWEYGKVFALMKLRFDSDGRVLDCGGQAVLVLGDGLRRRSAAGSWERVDGTAKQALLERIAARPEVRVVADDPETAQRLAPFVKEYAARADSVLGRLRHDQPLCFVRIPGDPNRGGPICQGVSAKASGSDVAQVMAEAYRSAWRRAKPEARDEADFGLINAGAVRIPLETDGVHDLEITRERAMKLDPFNNELYAVAVTGAEMKAILEDAVANWLDTRDSNGSHPYAAGLRWHLDLTQSAGRRFAEIEARDPSSAAWTPLDPTRSYRLVVSLFLSSGKEGYRTLGAICADRSAGRCATVGGVYTQDSFVSYLDSISRKPAPDNRLSRPACADYAHQAVRTATGSDLATCR